MSIVRPGLVYGPRDTNSFARFARLIEQGKMVMDGTVFHVAEHRCLSITSYYSDLDWFRKVASDRRLDVLVTYRTAEMPHLQVQGPKSREVLGPIDLEKLRQLEGQFGIPKLDLEKTGKGKSHNE